MAAEVGSFEAIQSHGWSSGFANMLRKELRDWWRTRFWVVQSLIWLAVLNGLVALAAFSRSATLGGPGPATGLQAFFVISPLFGPIGVAVLAQGAIVGEKQSGTAAWVLSKPVSRSAFILAKLLALGVGISAIVVALQGLVAFALSAAATGSSPAAPVPYAFALGLLALHLAFYITLALMVGTLFGSRGAVIGIALGVLFGQQFLGSML